MQFHLGHLLLAFNSFSNLRLRCLSKGSTKKKKTEELLQFQHIVVCKFISGAKVGIFFCGTILFYKYLLYNTNQKCCVEGSAICEITGFAVGRQCLPGLCAGFWYQVCQSLAPYRPPCYECLLIGPGAIGRANYVFSQFVNAGDCVSKISFWEDKIAGMGRYWFKLALGRHLTSQTSTLQFNPDFWETGSWSSLEIHVKGMIHCNTSSVYKMEG